MRRKIVAAGLVVLLAVFGLSFSAAAAPVGSGTVVQPYGYRMSGG